MSFIPDPSKQPLEAIFCRKVQKVIHPSIYFNKNPIKQVLFQKYVEIISDTRLNSQEHF